MTDHVKDISDAADLIATAREALLNELLPTLAKEQRYAGLMIGNAMAIALRESRSGADATRGEAARIASCWSDQSCRPEPGTAREGSELPRLRRALCAAIRDGRVRRRACAGADGASGAHRVRLGGDLQSESAAAGARRGMKATDRIFGESMLHPVFACCIRSCVT